MGLIRRNEKGETYYYWYNKGERIYLGKLTDRTVIDKIKYISSNLDSLSDEERKEFLAWIDELKAVLGLIPQSSKVENDKLDSIEKKLDKVLQILQSKEITEDELDRTYEFMKDSLGYVSIENIRKQLGMSYEEFMRKFRDYIIRNYELIPGGKEGILKNGVMYGIIRRKK